MVNETLQILMGIGTLAIYFVFAYLFFQIARQYQVIANKVQHDETIRSELVDEELDRVNYDKRSITQVVEDIVKLKLQENSFSEQKEENSE